MARRTAEGGTMAEGDPGFVGRQEELAALKGVSAKPLTEEHAEACREGRALAAGHRTCR